MATYKVTVDTNTGSPSSVKFTLETIDPVEAAFAFVEYGRRFGIIWPSFQEDDALKGASTANRVSFLNVNGSFAEPFGTTGEVRVTRTA